MKLKALKYMRYAGKPVQVGDVFECNAADVRILMALRRAETYVEPPPKKAVVKVEKPVEVPDAPEVRSWLESTAPEPTKRGYKRRDMAAEE